MSDNKTIAVIDIGSNSIVLLIARCYRDGKIEPLHEVFAITKLGEEVSKSGMLDQQAMYNTINAAKEMKNIAEAEGCNDIIAVATHAVRVAKNRSEFLVKFNQELNIFPQVISTKEEAKFTYLGATCDIEPDKDVLTIDIGGGSTEIAFGTRDIMVEAFSLPFGCVSICTKFNIQKRLWLLSDRTKAQDFVRKSLFSIVDSIYFWLKNKNPLVVVSGGSATTYSSILLGSDLFDRSQIHLRKSSRKELAAINRKISQLSVEERIKIPGMEKDRAEFLPGGLLILHEILTFFKFNEFIISANGIRFGIARDYIIRRF
ncbi:MAG TPA: hypothetical protein P5270_03405 [Victivallales bacterium]|nr:hypothetical protein [Victivallales bacterium]HRR28385.1 hypothetical protein [Victivallales bacterium]HRU01648.1 hypothetical protein [Victivallales bacterium]